MTQKLIFLSTMVRCMVGGSAAHTLSAGSLALSRNTAPDAAWASTSCCSMNSGW